MAIGTRASDSIDPCILSGTYHLIIYIYVRGVCVMMMMKEGRSRSGSKKRKKFVEAGKKKRERVAS